MVNYSKVSAEDCENLECLAEAYNLFALFDTPANVIFVDQFISNINNFKDIFTRYFSVLCQVVGEDKNPMIK